MEDGWIMMDVHVEPQVKGFQYNIFIYLLLLLSIFISTIV